MFKLLLIALPFIIAHFLILWNETEFFVEYMELFRLNNLFSVTRKFSKEREAGSPLNFKEFLAKNYKWFHIKLITCPKCLGTMLSLIVSVLIACFNVKIGALLWFPLAYLSLLLYKWGK